MAPQPYRSPVAPDPIDTSVAVHRAARAAKKYWLGAQAFAVSVQKAEVEGRTFSRALVEIEHSGRPGEVRRAVRVEPPSMLDEDPRLALPESFDEPGAHLPGDVVSDAVVTPESLPQELTPELDPATERVKSARVQQLSRAVVRVVYETALGVGSVDVAVHDSKIATSSVWQPLVLRRWLSLGAAGVGLAAGLGLFAAYKSRHEWFAVHGQNAMFVVVAVMLAVAGAIAVAELSLVPSARNKGQTLVAGGLGLACLISMWLIWRGTGPTTERALSALAAGRDADAALEARALIRLDQDVVEAQSILDELHLRKLKRSQDLKDMSRIAALDWYTSKMRDEGVEHFRKVARDTANTAYRRRNKVALEQLASPASMLDEESREHAKGLSRLLDVLGHIEAKDYERAGEALAVRYPSTVKGAVTALRSYAENKLTKQLEPHLNDRFDAATEQERRDAWEAAYRIVQDLKKLTGNEPEPSTSSLFRGIKYRAWTVQGEQAQRELMQDEEAQHQSIVDRMREQHEKRVRELELRRALRRAGKSG